MTTMTKTSKRTKRKTEVLVVVVACNEVVESA